MERGGLQGAGLSDHVDVKLVVNVRIVICSVEAQASWNVLKSRTVDYKKNIRFDFDDELKIGEVRFKHLT